MTGSPVHELLPVAADRGFTRLPEPQAGDIFLDLEGYPDGYSRSPHPPAQTR